MRKFGLIGYPLGHSFSKKFFTEKFITDNLTGCIYDNYPLENLDNFSEFINSDDELVGLNVTIPYKSDIMKYIDVIDKEASEAGAVNVIKIFRRNDTVKLYGFNSDITGILDSILPYTGNDLKNALVLGTGGSSKAVCHVLRKVGIHFEIVSRKHGSGNLTYNDISDEILDSTQLIVNTTPLGMFPDTERRPDINYSRLNNSHILFDLVYNPEYTMFLRSGKERGCQIISGLKMLYSQAERSWEIWNEKTEV